MDLLIEDLFFSGKLLLSKFLDLLLFVIFYLNIKLNDIYILVMNMLF